MNPHIHLQNKLVRFGFDRETGSLVVLENLRTGQQHLADPLRGRLFRVMCPSPKWRCRYADSQEAPPPQFQQEANRLTIHYPQLKTVDGPLPVSVTVHVELPEDQPEALFTMELTNHGTDRLHEVRFPWVGGWTGFAGRGQDRALCGIRPVDPYPKSPELLGWTTLSGMYRRQYHIYNHGMRLPFFDLSGGGRGISYICYQTRPDLGGMVMENLDPEPDALSWSFAWVHYPFTRPGETWRSPTIGVGVHEGDWHATADRLRSWLKTWWRAPKPPKRLRESIGFQTIMLRQLHGDPFHRFKDIPQLAEAGQKYGVADLNLWDPIASVYIRPDDGDFWEEFDPTQNLDDLRAALAETKRRGVNTSFMVNYRLIRRQSSLYRQIGADQVQRTLSGVPVTEDWTQYSSQHAAHMTPYLSEEGCVLCQKSEAFRQRALAITKQALDLGCTSLFIDQAFDYNPCFAEAHQHRVPADTHEAALEWCRAAARLVRERDPEAYVIGEVTDLFGMQDLDVTWTWFVTSEEVPEVMRYTLPETLQCWPVDHQPFLLNRAFILGYLVAFITGGVTKTLAAYPEFGRRVAQLALLRKRCADCFVQARFMDTIGLETENATAYVYASTDGLAVAFADLQNQARKIRLTLNPAALGRGAAQPGIIYRQEGSTAPAGQLLADGRIQLELELPALEVAIWNVPCLICADAAARGTGRGCGR